jgi:hypothetical protein
MSQQLSAMLPALLSGVPVSNCTKGIEKGILFAEMKFLSFLLFFQEACLSKLNGVKLLVIFEK